MGFESFTWFDYLLITLVIIVWSAIPLSCLKVKSVNKDRKDLSRHNRQDAMKMLRKIQTRHYR